MASFETIDNHRLIFNGLDHIEFELNHAPTSYFRVAREAHQVLYRSLIESLKGSANIAVTGKPRGKREHRYQIGNDPIKEIHKQPVKGCTRAWRFTDPLIVESFHDTKLNGDLLEPELESDDFLIPFYDALAMVQTDCFMYQYVHSVKVEISDTEMELLEWLHERIRNVYEHFVPKSYASPIHDLMQAATVALSKADACLMESNNILFFDHSVDEAVMEHKIDLVAALLVSHLQKAAGEAITDKP